MITFSFFLSLFFFSSFFFFLCSPVPSYFADCFSSFLLYAHHTEERISDAMKKPFHRKKTKMKLFHRGLLVREARDQGLGLVH
jgi:hypothetical protein